MVRTPATAAWCLLLVACVAAAPVAASDPKLWPPVAGRVVDEAGKPVRGAEVTLDPHVLGRDDEKVPVDADGRFSLAMAGTYAMVTAEAPGRSLSAARLYPGARSVVLRMGPAHELAGKVIGPDGRPAEGVTVRVLSVPASGDVEQETPFPDMTPFPDVPLPQTLRPRYSTVTDAHGIYRLQGVPAGETLLEFRDPRFVTRQEKAGDPPGEVRMDAGCRIRGRILGNKAGFAGWRAGWDTPLNPDGTFLLSSLRPGEHTISITTPEESDVVVPAATLSVTAEKRDAEVVMQAVPACTLLVRTVDAKTKAPVEGVWIHYYAPHRPKGVTPGSAVSGPDGRLRIRTPPGKVHLERYRPDHPRDFLDVTVAAGGENTVEFPVQETLTLTGVVVDGAGKPVPRAFVRTHWDLSHYSIGRATGADGRFRITNLPPGNVALTARRGDQGLAQPMVVELPSPDEVRLQIGPLPQAVLVGRVVDDTGRAAPGVPLLLEQSFQTGSTRGWSRRVAQATSDGQGRYRFVVHDLAAECRVRTPWGDHRTLEWGTLVGDQGAERRLTDVVVFSTRGSVSGRVVNAEGRPVPGASVFWASGTKAHLAFSDADGRFRITGLPERPVALVARGPKGGTAFAQATPGKDAVLVLKE